MTSILPPSLHNGLVSDEIRLLKFTHAAKKNSTKKMPQVVKKMK